MVTVYFLFFYKLVTAYGDPLSVIKQNLLVKKLFFDELIDFN